MTSTTSSTTDRTGRAVSRATGDRRPTAGVVAGLIGGIGMGLILQFVADAMPLIASLYGRSSALAGWVAHLAHSVILALLFVALLTRTGPRRSAGTVGGATALGTVCGIVLGLVTGGVVLPIWANAATGAGLPVPMLLAAPFAGHVLFGVLLGGAFAVLRRPVAETADAEAGDATGTEPEADSSA